MDYKCLNFSEQNYHDPLPPPDHGPAAPLQHHPVYLDCVPDQETATGDFEADLQGGQSKVQSDGGGQGQVWTLTHDLTLLPFFSILHCKTRNSPFIPSTWCKYEDP